MSSWGTALTVGARWAVWSQRDFSAVRLLLLFRKTTCPVHKQMPQLLGGAALGKLPHPPMAPFTLPLRSSLPGQPSL